MEEIIKVCVDNGIGIASFVALLYFIFKYQGRLETILTKVSDTLIQIQISLATLLDRVDKLEDKKKE